MVKFKKISVALVSAASLAAFQGIPLAHASAGPLPLTCGNTAHAAYSTATYQGGPVTFYWTVGTAYGQYTITHQVYPTRQLNSYQAYDNVTAGSGEGIGQVFISYPGSQESASAGCGL